jgi:hypothetical protein
MANYQNIEIDFIEHTLALIDQYESLKKQFGLAEHYNHRFLLN